MLYRFNFDDYPLLDEQVDAVADVQEYAAISQGHRDLALDEELSDYELISEA